jgi:hypothetical protein
MRCGCGRGEGVNTPLPTHPTHPPHIPHTTPLHTITGEDSPPTHLIHPPHLTSQSPLHTTPPHFTPPPPPPPPPPPTTGEEGLYPAGGRGAARVVRADDQRDAQAHAQGAPAEDRQRCDAINNGPSNDLFYVSYGGRGGGEVDWGDGVSCRVVG